MTGIEHRTTVANDSERPCQMDLETVVSKGTGRQVGLLNTLRLTTRHSKPLVVNSMRDS